MRLQLAPDCAKARVAGKKIKPKIVIPDSFISAEGLSETKRLCILYTMHWVMVQNSAADCGRPDVATTCEVSPACFSSSTH